MTDGFDDRPWALVAAAGFADALEGHGFQRTGKFLWRRPGDGVRSAVVMTRDHVSSDFGFTISYGVEALGLDAIIKQTGIKGLGSGNLYHSRVRIHAGSDLLSDLIQEIAVRREEHHRAYLKRHRAEHGWLSRFQPRLNNADVFRQMVDAIPFTQRHWRDPTAPVLSLEGHGPAEVAAFCIREWERLAVPWLDEVGTYRALYQEQWGPEKPPHIQADPERFAAAKLAGDQAHIEAMAAFHFERALQPVKFFKREVQREELRLWDPIQAYKKGNSDRPSLRKAWSIQEALLLLQLSGDLDLGLNDPGLDIEFVRRQSTVWHRWLRDRS